MTDEARERAQKIRRLAWRIDHHALKARRWWIVGYRRTRAEARRDCAMYRRKDRKSVV